MIFCILPCKHDSTLRVQSRSQNSVEIINSRILKHKKFSSKMFSDLEIQLKFYKMNFNASVHGKEVAQGHTLATLATSWTPRVQSTARIKNPPTLIELMLVWATRKLAISRGKKLNSKNQNPKKIPRPKSKILFQITNHLLSEGIRWVPRYSMGMGYRAKVNFASLNGFGNSNKKNVYRKL